MSGFKSVFELYKDGELTDFTLTVGGKDIRVHRVVIASHSPVFRAMLLSPMAEKASSVVKIPDCDKLVFLEFIKFLYCGTCNLFKFPLDMLEIAHKYQVMTLVEECALCLEDRMDLETVLDVFEAAHLYDLSSLECKAMELIRNVENYGKIRLTDDWKDLAKRNFQLMTHLITSFPQRMCSHPAQQLLYVQGDRLRTDTSRVVSFVEWQFSWALAHTKNVLSSPLINVRVAGQYLSFKFQFHSAGDTKNRAHFRILLMSNCWKPPFKMTPNYILRANHEGKTINSKTVVSWPALRHHSPKWSAFRERHVLSFPRRDFTSDNYSIGGQMIFQFHYCLSHNDKIIYPFSGESVPGMAPRLMPLSRSLLSYFKGTDKIADVYFKLGNTLIAGHRHILANVPFFAQLFCQKREVYVLPFEPEVFRVVFNQFHADALWKPSEYEENGYSNVISPSASNLQALIKKISNPNTLKEQALRVMRYHITSSLVSSSWKKLKDDPDLVTEIVDSLALPLDMRPCSTLSSIVRPNRFF